MTDNLIDVMNLANIGLGSVAFCLLFARTSIRRLEYPDEVLLLLIALQAVVVALLITSAELILVPNDLAPLGHLIFISTVITAVKINLLWVLWATRTSLYRTSERHTGDGRNTDEMDVNENFADHPKSGT